MRDGTNPGAIRDRGDSISPCSKHAHVPKDIFPALWKGKAELDAELSTQEQGALQHPD